jgi:hypothetical protein
MVSLLHFFCFWNLDISYKEEDDHNEVIPLIFIRNTNTFLYSFLVYYYCSCNLQWQALILSTAYHCSTTPVHTGFISIEFPTTNFSLQIMPRTSGSLSFVVDLCTCSFVAACWQSHGIGPLASCYLQMPPNVPKPDIYKAQVNCYISKCWQNFV